MVITKKFEFCASHILTRHDGKCARLHGHNWVLEVSVEGKIDIETGFVMDYAVLKKYVQPLIENLDHKHLGQWAYHTKDSLPTGKVSGTSRWGIVEESAMLVHAPSGWNKFLYPSSENLLWWIGRQLKEAGLDWWMLALDETCTSSATLSRMEFDDGVVYKICE